MGGDFCWACDGTGDRDWLSGAPCYKCNGTGWLEDHEADYPYDYEDYEDESR